MPTYDENFGALSADSNDEAVYFKTLYSLARVVGTSATPLLSYRMMAKCNPRLFLIDSFGFIFRAFHAAPTGAPPMRTPPGSPPRPSTSQQHAPQALQGAPARLHAAFRSGEVLLGELAEHVVEDVEASWRARWRCASGRAGAARA